MLIPNRHGNSGEYRYGFQGQEKDDELKGEGNSLNYTFRMHDPRVGRFFARDPLEKYYAEQTPYQFSSNAPIHARELEGCETAHDMRFERRERQLLAGEITPEQFRVQNNAEGLGALLGVALLATVYTGGKAAPLIGNAYGSYCTWFGTTQLANSTYLGYIANPTNLFVGRTTIGLGFFNAGTNAAGQLMFNDGKEFNFSGPVFGFIMPTNPFYSNLGESYFNFELKKGFSTNNFDKTFFTTFASNLIGDKLSNGLSINTPNKLTNKGINSFTTSITEFGENYIQKSLDTGIDLTKSFKDYADDLTKKMIKDGLSTKKRK